MARHWLAPTLHRHTLPAKTRQILSPLIATQFEISKAQQRVGIGERPSPIAALAFQTAEAGDFLQQQGVPVAIGGERLEANGAVSIITPPGLSRRANSSSAWVGRARAPALRCSGWRHDCSSLRTHFSQTIS